MAESKNKDIGPYVDRIEITPDMVWPSPEGRVSVLEEIVEDQDDNVGG